MPGRDICQRQWNLNYVGVAPSVVPLLNAMAAAKRARGRWRHRLCVQSPVAEIREDFGTRASITPSPTKTHCYSGYTIDDSDANTPSVNPLSLMNITLREQVFSIQEQHVISPSFLNTARLGFSERHSFSRAARQSTFPDG